MTHQHSQMWTPSLRVRYQCNPVLIPRNNQYEAITPLYLLLSSLPSSEMGDHDTETEGCMRCVCCPYIFCIEGECVYQATMG